MKRLLGIGIPFGAHSVFHYSARQSFCNARTGIHHINTVTNDTTATEIATNTDETQQAPQIIADNLHVPWDVVFLPNGAMLVSERSGNILLITETEKRQIHKGWLI